MIKPKQTNKKPDKQAVRDWLTSEISKHRPPPPPSEIRRELGMDMIREPRRDSNEDR